MFKFDGPVLRIMDMITNLLILNFLTLICCIPIVTAGAAFSALHYVMLKIVRGEESYIARNYFKAFKRNFKQSTILWLIMLVVYALLYIDFRMCILYRTTMSGFVLILVAGVALEVFLISLYVFPVISRYEYSNVGILKTSLTMSVVGLKKFRTILSGIAMLLPWIALYFGGFGIIPIIVFFFFSVPAFLRAMLYSNMFKEFEHDGVEEKETEIEVEEMDNAEV